MLSPWLASDDVLILGDLGIALEEAAAMDLHFLPGLSAADQLYRLLCSQGN